MRPVALYRQNSSKVRTTAALTLGVLAAGAATMPAALAAPTDVTGGTLVVGDVTTGSRVGTTFTKDPVPAPTGEPKTVDYGTGKFGIPGLDLRLVPGNTGTAVAGATFDISVLPEAPLAATGTDPLDESDPTDPSDPVTGTTTTELTPDCTTDASGVCKVLDGDFVHQPSITPGMTYRITQLTSPTGFRPLVAPLPTQTVRVVTAENREDADLSSVVFTNKARLLPTRGTGTPPATGGDSVIPPTTAAPTTAAPTTA
ncbi:MAG: hypothetical protein JWP46_4152, partial [Modestobacter sp.]|nr:hypothetical protein [Modestobacter sp.]